MKLNSNFILACVALSSISTCMPFSTRLVFANSELDRQFSLETLGILKSTDNVDGVFSESVAALFKEYFSKQTRFIIQDLSKTDSIFSKSKMPYAKIINDTALLSQLARSLRTESLIRTKITKESNRYRVLIEWLHAPKMDLMASHTFELTPSENNQFSQEDLHHSFFLGLDELLRQIPFIGHITGRDKNSVTLNLGLRSGIRKGDTLIISTLDEARKHPLTGQIVDWHTAQTGRVEIEEVEDQIAFAKIIEEAPGRQISRFQKVVQVIAKPSAIDLAADQQLNDRNNQKQNASQADLPRIGWFSSSAWLGTLSRQISSMNNSSGATGSGLFLGARADGQLWISRDLFADASLGYGISGYSQKDTATGTQSSVSGSPSLMNLNFGVGYNLYPTGKLDGPRGFARVGYQSTKYTFTSSAADSLEPSQYSGISVGIGADLPLRAAYGAYLAFDFGLSTTGKLPSNTIVTATHASSFHFAMGGMIKFDPHSSLRIGLDIQSQSMDLSNTQTLSQRVVSFGPMYLLYF